MPPPKVVQVVAKYDGALVALTTTGRLYELNRGKQEWDTVAGIEGGAHCQHRGAPFGPIDRHHRAQRALRAAPSRRNHG
jgi:hypothetical protein